MAEAQYDVLPRLGAKQRRFLEELMELPIHERTDRAAQREAARRAGYTRPGNAITALMKNRTIQATLMSAMPVVETVRQGIDDAWFLSELVELWDTELSSLFDEDGVVLPIHEMPTRAQKLLAGFETRTEFEQLYDEEGNLTQERVMRVVTSKIRLIDRLKVLTTIGQTTKVNAFGDKEKSDAAGAFADLLRAATAAAKRGEPIDIEAIRKELANG